MFGRIGLPDTITPGFIAGPRPRPSLSAVVVFLAFGREGYVMATLPTIVERQPAG